MSATSIGTPERAASDVAGRPRYATGLTYTDRPTKAAYIADKYRAILGGSVLDVGCDAAPLRGLVARPDAYVGVDIRPDADLVVNLDKEDLPVGDQSFDTVVCTDVLEHLERCHAVFDGLCRASRRHVVVSLPNPLHALMDAIANGSQGRLKYYGLPVDPPADRHRWFFGHEEAVEFLTQRGRLAGFEVEQMDTEPGGCPSWRTRQGENLLGSANVREGTLWCVLRRAGATPA
ncbi:MAG: methyltransferase domain-containing protein [Phycisphaerales bacterium]